MSTGACVSSRSLVTSLLDAAVVTYGARPCTYFLGRRLSFAEIGRLSDQAAHGLQALGVGEGVKVGLLLPNSPTFVIFYHGILKAGGTVVNFNPLYSVEEIEFQARDSGTRIMVTLDLAATFDKVEPLLTSGALDHAVVASFAKLLPAMKSLGVKLRRGPKLAKVAASPEKAKILRERDVLANGGNYQRPTLPQTPSRCCNIPAAPPARRKARCSPTPTSPPMCGRSRRGGTIRRRRATACSASCRCSTCSP